MTTTGSSSGAVTCHRCEPSKRTFCDFFSSNTIGSGALNHTIAWFVKPKRYGH